MTTLLDVNLNRRERKYSRREQLARVMWAFAFPFFRLSPRPFWGWRRWVLRSFGAHVGRDAHVYPTARITMPWHITFGDDSAIGDRAILYALGPITIGARATVSQGAHLCAGTHDLNQRHRPLLKIPITVGADAWIAADAFVGPGVSIGERAVVGARAVVARDVPAGWIMVGNPAQKVREVEP